MSQPVLRIVLAVAALSIVAFGQQSNLLPNTTSLPSTRTHFQTERHLLDSPAGDLYYDSAFAHGYRHGYEEGFHVGDLDLQMGREPRGLSRIPEYKHDSAGFKSNFGGKELFRRGYREGFHSGYQDAVSGSEFRETEKAEVAAQGIKLLFGSGQRAAFDQGFSGGYESAAGQGSTSKLISADYLQQYCEKSQSPGHTYVAEYCSGYSRGYLLGLEDHGAVAEAEIAGEPPQQ